MRVPSPPARMTAFMPEDYTRGETEIEQIGVQSIGICATLNCSPIYPVSRSVACRPCESPACAAKAPALVRSSYMECKC